MKKKSIFIILITLLTILIVDLFSYFSIWYSQQKSLKEIGLDYIKLPSYLDNRFVFHDHSTLWYFEENKNIIQMRNPVGQNFSKEAIWLFGGSFAYGADMTLKEGLPDNKNFGYKLAEKTKRPLYNISIPGWGIQHMLYQLKKYDTFAKLPEPKYVIFFHTSDYVLKMIKYTYDVWNNGAYLRYKLDKNGKLYKVKPFLEPLWNFYFVKVIFNIIEYKILLNDKNFDNNFDLMNAMFIESADIIKKHYPNAKFIILKYNETNGFDEKYYTSTRWKELKEYGIEIIDAEKLINKNLKDKEYICKDNYHPSEKAYDEIAEELSKILK